MEEVLDIQQQVPQQEDPPIKKLYKGLYADKKYTKSFDEFKKQYSTPEAIDKLYTGLREDGDYTKEKSDFHKQYFSDIAAPSKKKVGSVVFGETYSSPELDSETPSTGKIPEVVDMGEGDLLPANPIALSKKYDELNNATKEVSVPSSGKGGQLLTTVPDEDSKKLAKQVKEYLGDIDPDQLNSEMKGLADEDINLHGDELLTDRKENPQLYQRKLGSLKWKRGLDEELTKSLESGRLNEDDYNNIKASVQSSLQNSSVGDYKQQRENVNSVANAIKEFGGENKDKLLKDYAVEVSKVYGNSYNFGFDKTVTDTPESKYLDNTEQLGLHYIKDLDPEKAKQYDRLMVDPKTLKDDPDALKGYNHLKQTLAETGLGLQQNSVTEELNNLKNIAAKNGGLTPEQLEQAKVLETKNDELSQKREELNSKYPDRINDKVDDAMQEILGQRLGWGRYAAGSAGKAIKNTAEGVWEAVSTPFMSDESNRFRELAIMGESLDENKLYNKSDANKALVTDTLVIKPELQIQIDAIVNDKGLSREQKELKLYPLLKENSDKFGRVPIQGGKFNISPSSVLYGLTDLGTTLLPFIGLEAATGGIGGAGTAAKFLRTFTAAAATSFHDEYANAITEGLPESEAYKRAMGITAINSLAMAGAGTPEAIKSMAGLKTSAGKIISRMSDAEIQKVLDKGGSKVMNALKDRVKATPKMLEEGLKSGGKFELAMTGAAEAKHQLYNTDIDREQNFKHSLLNIANFGIMGGVLGHAGYKSPTELQKSSLVEFGKSPDSFLSHIDEMKKNGELSPAEYDQRKALIEKSADAFKTLPEFNDKGKPLSEKQKGDILYNTVIKNEGKKAASTLPPRQAEKAEMASMVADHANGIILENPTLDQLNKRAKSLEGKLMPKMDSDGKSIELTEKEKKNYEAELQAVNDAIKHKESFDNSVKLERRNLQEQKDTPEEVVPNEPLSDVSGEGSVGVGVEAKLEKPSAEQQLKDIEEGNMVTFEYKNESEVPEVFKDKISSKGEVNGKTYVKVTMAKSLADYHLKEQSLKETPKSETKPIQNEQTKAPEIPITSKGESPTTTTVDKVSGTAEEGTGGKPPTETEVNISVGDGKEQIGISHAEFDKVSKELGLNAPYEKEPQTLEQWHKEADERLAKGDMPDVIAKMEKGDMPSSAEQLMIAKYVAGLKYEYNKTGSDAVLKEFRRIKELSDKAAGAEWGRIGVARQQMIDVNPLEGGLLSATAAKMDANGGELTEKQKAEVEKQVDKYKKAAEEEKKLREEAEQKNEDLIAQMEIDRMSAENKRSSTKGVKPKDSKEKRQALKDKLKDQWQQFKDEGQKLGISSNNNSFIISTKMAKTIAEIAKSYVDDGVTKLSDVVSKVYDEIKGFIPNVTERDIRDVIAGKYNEKKETRNELQAKWYDIQREQKLLNELERVMSGKPKNEKQTIQKNKRLAELRDQIDKVKKEKGLDQYSDEQKLKNLKSSNDKAAERLKKRIADKDFAPEKPKSFIENFEFKRKYPKLYNDVINAIHRKDEAAHEFDIALNNDRMAKEGKAKKVFKFFGKIKNTFQSLVAGVDDSMAFVQLGWSLLVNPKTAVNFKKYTDKDGKVKFAVGGAIKEHALDAWSKSRFDRQMTALHNSPAWPLIQASELDVLEPQSLLAKQKEEMFQHNLANKVGIGTINLGKSLSLEGTKLEGLKRVNLGKFLEIWERAYTSLGNNVRVDLFLRQAKLLYENGMTIENNLQEFKDLAKGINNLTGRGTTHAKVAPIVPFVTPVIWSPKMIASSINLLGLSDITGKQAGFYSKMSPEARKYVVKQMATGIGIAASTMMAAAVGGATVHYDPRDPQFGEIEYDNGKKSFNVFLRYAGYIRLIAQLWPGFLGGGRKNASGQVVSPYDEGGKTVGSVIGSFFRGKTNPASGLAYDYFLNDKEGFFDRQPMTLKTSAEQMLMPMSLRQVRSQLEKDGTLALLNYTLPNFVGIPMKDRQEYVTQDLNVPEWKFLDDKGLRVTPHKKETLEPIDDNGKPIEVTESKYQDFLKKREDYIQEDIKKLMDGKGYVENGEGNWEGLKKSDVKDLTTDELKGWLMTKTTQANEKAMMDVFKGTQAPKNTGKRKIETE